MCGRIAVLVGSMMVMLPAHIFDFGTVFTVTFAGVRRAADIQIGNGWSF